LFWYPRKRGGFVLYLILPLIGIFAFGLVLGINHILYSQKRGLNEYYKQQAIDLAQSGLNHTLIWFQSQDEQPVLQFNPVSVETIGGPLYLNWTGLVRTFTISEKDNIEGKYIVLWDDVRDISPMRMGGVMSSPRPGIVWEVHSKGVVYIERDPLKLYNQSPNEVLKEVELVTELRRLSIMPPTNAALCVDTGGNVSVNQYTWIYGGGGYVGTGNIGIAYKHSPRPPNARGGREVRVPLMELEPYNVFGFNESQIRTMADYRVSDVNALPNPIPAYSLIYGDTTLGFNNSRPLSGSGVLFVDGDLNITYNNKSSYFAGFIYVKGKIHITGGGFVLEGAIVAPSGGDFLGTAAQYTTIAYSPDMISLVGKYVGNYRISLPNIVEY